MVAAFPLLVAALTIGSFAVAVATTGIVRQYAIRRDLLDHPNARSSHSTPTPRGGGLGILIAAALGTAVAAWLGIVDRQYATVLAIGTALIAGIGWVDDTKHVPARVRLVIHLGVAVGTVALLGGLPSLRIGPTTLGLGVIGFVVGVMGIVWSINLFNFMDGVDGLAGSQAVLIFGIGAGLLFFRGDTGLGVIAAILAASSAGFLKWNWPPAKIFLGDIGSGAIGYLVASLSLLSENHGTVPLLVFAILGGVFIADATVTLLRRASRGHPPHEAHRDHAYQRLARAWEGHRSVSLAAAGLTILLGVLGFAGTIRPSLLLPAFLVAVGLLAGVLLMAERRAPM